MCSSVKQRTVKANNSKLRKVSYEIFTITEKIFSSTRKVRNDLKIRQI